MSNLHQKLLHQKVKQFQPLEVDVTMDILNILLKYRSDSPFVKSLHEQYCNRGGLSKKQLEGLHNKAGKVKEVPASKLATLEAIILKKPTRHKSSLPLQLKDEVKDEVSGKMISEILEKYPQHKRVLLLQSNFKKSGRLTVADIAELQKFHTLLIKSSSGTLS
jgi:hypothetical protein